MENGSYEGHMSSERNRKVRGSFLFLDQTKENKFDGGEKKKNKRKEERKEWRGKQKRRENKSVRGKGMKKGKERKIEKRERRETTMHSPISGVPTVGSR